MGRSGNSINVISRESGSGARSSFIELFGIQERTETGGRIDRTSRDAVVVNRAGVMLTTVANDPNAIGYISLASLNHRVRAVNIDGVKPTVENVISGAYPIARPFNIVTTVEPSELTGVSLDFINFILSAEGQAIASHDYMSAIIDAPIFSGTQPSGRIVVGGSSSVTPVMESLIEAYLIINPNAYIEIQSINSTTGVTGTIDGIFHIGMVSRQLRGDEHDFLTETAIAIDVFAIIVNARNSLTGLTTQQAREIFTGQTTSWNEVSP